MPGAEVANQPGAWSWNELNTRDAGSAKSFYSQVFDWSFSDMEIGGGTYTTFKPPSRGEDDESAGGLLDMQTMGVPDHVPPHWLSYFTVDSLDESLEQAKGAGANVNAGPMVFPQGKLAVLVDPLGGAFGLWEVTA